MIGLLASVALSANLLIAINYDFPTTELSRRALYKKHRLERKELRTKCKREMQKETGLQTVQEYEYKSRVKDKARGDGEFVPRVRAKDWKYFPHPKYKIVRYNTPPGTPEINLHRKYRFDRQEDLPGIVASDFSIMVYPSVHYYAESNCTTCDVYVIPLDKSLTDIEKIKRANVAKRWKNPIFSTEKSVAVKDTFRTITPIDFSVDNSKLVAKEKVGNNFDGIWNTDVLVYDFKTRETTKLTEVRDAIRYYWKNQKNIDLKDYLWDIYPMGFATQNSEMVIVSAYAYTGKRPIFLGYWSVDYLAQRSELVSLRDTNVPVSVIGYKLATDGNLSYRKTKKEMKQAKKEDKQIKKDGKKANKQRKKEVKKIYKEELKELKAKQKLETQIRKKRYSHPSWKIGPTS